MRLSQKYLSRISLFILFSVVTAWSQIDSTGIKLLEQRKYSEAQAFFELAVKKNTKDAEAYYQLSRTLLFQRKNDDAQDAIEEAIDINEHVAKYHFMRGQVLGAKAMNANIFSQGILAPKIKNAFLRAVELDPLNVEARSGLYNYYVQAPGIMGGSDEKAFEQANEIVKLNPYRGHFFFADYYQRKKDFDSAEKEFKTAIALEPKKTAAYKNLGYFYVGQKRYADAVEQFKKYVELDPNNSDSYDSYADALKAAEQYDEAIAKYQYALFVDGKFSASIFSMAECYEKKGMKQKAKETYQWFLTLETKGKRAEQAQQKVKELQ